MNASAIISALDIPPGARVEQRVPKKLLLENGAPTTSDKRLISEGIEELLWVAALKPTTVGIPEYRDEAREYFEVAVLRLTLRVPAKAQRLVELVHRAVPYPVLLVVDHAEMPGVSAAHKRRSQGEPGKTVLDGDVVTVAWEGKSESDRWSAFLAALPVSRQPRATLYALYEGWLDTLHALQASKVTGVFSTAGSAERAAARREGLRECARIETEIVRLRAAAEKETQLPRQVELNLELKRLEAAQDKERLKL